MMSANRFDLEQEIMDCWNVTSDLRLLADSISEEQGLTKEQLSIILRGLSQLYELKFSRTFSTFEELLSERKII